MSRYVRLSQTQPLFLVERDVTEFIPTVEDISIVEKSVNHMFLIDRSGSMSAVLPKLGDDLVARLKELPNGDSVSFGWFSGEGDYHFVIKGFKISEGNDFKILEDIIRRNLSPRGCTCFSEILFDVNQVIEDLLPFGNLFSLFFFTDGYPVVSNYTQEIINIQKAIEKVSGKISTALLVGYGEYYNRELLSQMSEWFGGSMVHNSELKDLRYHIESFILDSHENSGKVDISLDSNPTQGIVFSLNGRSTLS